MTKYGYHRRHFTDLSGVLTALTDSAYGYHRQHFTDISGVLIALTDNAYGYYRFLTTPTDTIGSTHRLR